MRYEIQWNKLRSEWIVWKVRNNGNAEVVKHFKTETGAKAWVAKQRTERW